MTVTNGLAGCFVRRARSLPLLAAVCVLLASCGGPKSSSTPTLAAITVTPASPSIAANATQQFTATAKDSSGNTMSGVAFSWASSSSSVATINSSTGMAAGVSAGTTQITASASGISSSADTLTVTGTAIATITVTPPSPTIAVSSTQQFTATAKDSSGNTLTGVTFTWASSVTSVATISAGGLATGVASGTTQITAAASGVTSAPDSLQVTTPVTSSVVTGTASMGLPIANALITLKDSAGQSVSGTTASDGTYSLITTGMTPPFLIQVQATSGNVYSVSADALTTTTVNTHVLSDLVIRSWYSAQGQSIDTAFSNPVTLPAPSVQN
ncbi:MAG: Ig-like domain-containing protein, partial [Terracidiphilus sp.]